MDLHREHARLCLEVKGFRTEYLDEADEERADLLVSDDASKYVVEVKGKEASEAYQRLCTEANKGEIATLTRHVCYWNRLDAIVRKANSQLANTPSEVGAFRVLWVSCLMGDVDFIHRQFEKTLYGMEDLALYDLTRQALPSIMPCFYYHNSSFYRYRDVVAVILSGPDSGHVCINEFSPRSCEFRRTRMYNLFPEAAIIDPVHWERSGKALAIRAEIDRTDAKAKWTFLHETFGYMTALVQEGHFTGMLSVPLDDS